MMTRTLYKTVVLFLVAVSWTSQELAVSAAFGAAGDVDQTIGNLSVRLPAGWQSAPGQAEDEGQWFVGDASAPDACFSVVRDRLFEDFAAVLEVTNKSDGTLSGLKGQKYDGTLELAAGPGRATVWMLQQNDGASIALICTARSDRWDHYGPVFEEILASIRIHVPKDDVPSGPDTAMPIPATPSVPSTTPQTPVTPSTPRQPPPPPAPPQPPGPVSIGVDPSFLSCPSGKQWYYHGRGDYRFPIPSDWVVRENTARGTSDFDFDTISSPDGRCFLVCARICERVANADAALDRWLAERQRDLSRENIQVTRPEGAARPTLIIYYQESRTGLMVFRISFVAQGRRYPLTLYAKPELGVNGVMQIITPMLTSLQLLRDERALSRWRPTQAGPFRLRVPPDWESLNVSFDNPSTVAFQCGNEAWIYVEKRNDRSGFTVDMDPLLKAEDFRVGNRSATAYVGTLPESGSTKMAVVLDWKEPDGQSYGFWCQTRKGQWARHETTFRQFLAQVQSDSPPDEVSDLKPRPVGELKRFSEMASLRLESNYSMIAYSNGVIIKEEATGRTEIVFPGRCDPGPWSVFNPFLQQNPDWAQWLGPAVSRCVPVFEDQIRVQLFNGGAMVSATPTRALWYCGHTHRNE